MPEKDIKVLVATWQRKALRSSVVEVLLLYEPILLCKGGTLLARAPMLARAASATSASTSARTSLRSKAAMGSPLP